VNRRHEIELKAVILPHDAKQVRRRIVWPQHRGSKRARERLELAQVARRLAKQEIEIDGRHGGAL